MSERIRRAGLVAWGALGLVGVLALVGLVGWYVRVIWPPLIFAGAIVFLLNPVVTVLQHRGLPRAAGAAVSYLGVVAAMVLVGVVVAPLAAEQADELSAELPHVVADVEGWIDDRAEQSAAWPVRLPTVAEIERELGGQGEPLSERVETVRAVGVRVLHILVVAILAPIIAFYLLVDLPRLRRVAESLVPARANPEVLVVAARLNRAIGGFFRGQLLVAVIVGVMISLGLALIGLPFWLLVGMVAGLFNVVPLIGPWVGAVPGVVIALTTGDLRQAALVGVVMVVAQQVDNHFISPLVMQRAVKLHPAAVMVALLAGGTLFGLLGLLLAVPTAAVLKILVGHLWRTYVLEEPLDERVDQWREDEAAPGVGPVTDVVEAADGAVGADPDPAERPEPVTGADRR